MHVMDKKRIDSLATDISSNVYLTAYCVMDVSIQQSSFITGNRKNSITAMSRSSACITVRFCVSATAGAYR